MFGVVCLWFINKYSICSKSFVCKSMFIKNIKIQILAEQVFCGFLSRFTTLLLLGGNSHPICLTSHFSSLRLQLLTLPSWDILISVIVLSDYKNQVKNILNVLSGPWSLLSTVFFSPTVTTYSHEHWNLSQ
jgi:hypothetical protein